MKLRPSTLLNALNQERDEILALLNMKPEKLKSDLAAVERLIAIYQERTTEQAITTQPKTLRAAAQLRADIHGSHGNGNGNGTSAKPVSQRKQKLLRQMDILQHMTKGPLSKPAMSDLIKSITGKSTAQGNTGTFVVKGWLGRDKSGTYTITSKGRQRLAALTAVTAP